MADERRVIGRIEDGVIYEEPLPPPDLGEDAVERERRIWRSRLAETTAEWHFKCAVTFALGVAFGAVLVRSDVG